MLWATPFLLLSGVIVFAATGRILTLLILLGISMVAVGVALARDMGDRGTYTLEGEVLVLETARDRAEIPLSEVLDVSLIDRAGAREYVLSALREKGVRGFFDMRRAAKAYLRFTAVDIGLTSFTLGLGRSMIDRMPDARHDLLLLRLRNGDTHLLSPQSNQEMVSLISRRTMERT